MRSSLLFLLASSAIGATTPTSDQFAARRDYLTPVDGKQGGASLIRAADINGDKIPDLVASNPGNTVVETLLGKGKGIFGAGPASPTNFQGISGMALMDLNGDGVIDLAISGTASNGVSGIGICFGNGDGTFQLPVFYAAGTDYMINDLVLGDFNGDGIPDVAITRASGVWLFLGQGGGVFSSGVLTPVKAPSLIEGVVAGRMAAADFNGDGHLDLAVAFDGDPGGFVLLLGNGNGTFQTPTFHDVPPYGAQNYIAAGDLNHDGHPDIVLSPDGGGVAYVNVLLNNGKGQFSAPIQVNMNGSTEIAIGDVNGDGIPDIVNSLGTIVLGEGGGKFGSPISYAVENCQFAHDVILAQLHRSGLLDIVAAQDQAVSVLLNEGKGNFEDGEWMSVPGAGNCAAAADFNGDGKPDLAVPTSNGIVILLGTGNATSPYTTGATIPISSPGCPITGDINGDGIPDILVGASSLGGVGTYLGNGDGTFTLKSVAPVGSGIIVFGDFNHDGKLDFADSTNQLCLGNGDGTFQPPVSIVGDPIPTGYSWIAAGDINNDGWTDILLTSPEYAYAYLVVLVNNQLGGFTQTLISDEAGPQGVALADLNGSGDLGAVVWPVAGGAQVYLGNGKGGFTLQTQTPGYPGLNHALDRRRKR
jgi:hypothetical protein